MNELLNSPNIINHLFNRMQLPKPPLMPSGGPGGGPDPIGSGGPKRPPQPMGVGDGRFLGLGANWTGQMGTPWTNWKGLGANQHLAGLMKLFRGPQWPASK
jgi:hypothetical protein